MLEHDVPEVLTLILHTESREFPNSTRPHQIHIGKYLLNTTNIPKKLTPTKDKVQSFLSKDSGVTIGNTI